MTMELDEIYSAITKKSFETFITKDKKLIIQHPMFSNEEWELLFNTNSGEDINYFYSIFPEGHPKGTWELIQQSLIKFYKK